MFNKNKEVTLTQPGPLCLASNWWANKLSEQNLEYLCGTICHAVFTGNDAAFQYAIHGTAINSYIGCILKPVFNNVLSMIVIAYTDETLDRAIKFLKEIVYNYHSREVTANEQLFHLSQVFLCLLLGPMDLNEYLSDDQTQVEEEINQTDELEQSSASNVYQQLDEVQSDIKTSAQNEVGFVNIKQEEMHYEDVKEPEPSTSFQAMQVMSNEASQPKVKKIKQELKENFSNSEPGTSYQVQPTYTVATNEKNSTDHDQHNTTKNTANRYSSLITQMCPEKSIDDLCALVSSMASIWGYFQGEIIFVATKRIEIYFNNLEANVQDYQWLMRAIRLLSALGGYAFRELAIYFNKVDSDAIPEDLQCHLNFAATFIRGRSDTSFYEYLSEVCGDGLLPFMVYYSKYIVKKSRKSVESAKQTYKITPKLLLRTINKIENKILSLDDAFEDRVPLKRRKIGFKFAGCCPVILKTRMQPPNKIIQQADLLTSFNSKVVICKRKMLKSLSDVKCVERKSDFRSLRIT